MDVRPTIKAKLLLGPDARLALKSTMQEFNRACKTLSAMAFEEHQHRRYDTHHAGCRLVREEKLPPSRHVINAIAKVGAACSVEVVKDATPADSAAHIARQVLNFR